MLTCLLPAAPMRLQPSHRAEMVNQLLFGDQVELLRTEGDWQLVRSAYDGYEGWVDHRQLSPARQFDSRSVVTTPFRAVDYDGATLLLPGGSLLPEGGEEEASDPVAVALQYVGAPYLWGGRTAMGIDCSGLMQVVFKICGVPLPRDAWQQALCGSEVSLGDCRPGDLAFFDNAEGRIVHVGLVSSCRPLQILHASSQVRVSPLDSEGIVDTGAPEGQSKAYTHHLKTLRRVLPQPIPQP